MLRQSKGIRGKVVGDFDQFARKITLVIKRVETRAPMLQRLTAVAALKTLVMATPVGNKSLWRQPQRARPGYVGGRARGNWFVGINQAVHTQSEAVDAGGGGTIARGTSVAQGSRQGDTLYVTNNLPYIVPLNNGSSHQAPAGFVEIAIRNAQQTVRGSRLLEE